MVLNEGNFTEQVEESDVPVLVDFWAAWCRPCNMMTPVIEEIAREHEGRFRVGKVNVSEQRSLADQNKVSSIPAFLFFKDGKEKARLVGVQKKEALMRELEKLE